MVWKVPKALVRVNSLFIFVMTFYDLYQPTKINKESVSVLWQDDGDDDDDDDHDQIMKHRSSSFK